MRRIKSPSKKKLLLVIYYLPQLIEAQVQPSCKLTICVTEEVWNVLTVMSNEGNLKKEKKGGKQAELTERK